MTMYSMDAGGNYCSHCVGVVARCALLRHAFPAQITTTCSQSKQVKCFLLLECYLMAVVTDKISHTLLFHATVLDTAESDLSLPSLYGRCRTQYPYKEGTELSSYTVLKGFYKYPVPT